MALECQICLCSYVHYANSLCLRPLCPLFLPIMFFGFVLTDYTQNYAYKFNEMIVIVKYSGCVQLKVVVIKNKKKIQSYTYIKLCTYI